MIKALKHGSHKHLLAGLLVILIIAIVSLPACNTNPVVSPPPVLVPPAAPQRADLLCSIEPAIILNNETFAELYLVLAARNEDMPQTLDDALLKVKNEAGIDLRNFTKITVFTDTPTLNKYLDSPQDRANVPYFGVLVEGDLDTVSFISGIEASTAQKLQKSDYQGHVIYTIGPLNGEDEVLSVACPTASNFVIGTGQAVKDVIDVTAGLQEPVGGKVFDLYSRLGDAPAKVSSVVPEYLTQQIPEQIALGPLNIDLRSLRDIEYATLTLSGNESIIDAEARLEFSSEDSASTSEKLISTGILAAKALLPDPAVKELLSKVHTSRSGSSVSLMLALTVSEIDSFITAMSEQAKP